MGLVTTNWALDFRQYRFHPAMQVLRVCEVCAFSAPPAFPPCSCPLHLSAPVRRLTSRISSKSYPDSSGIQFELLRRTARHERTLFAVACTPWFGLQRYRLRSCKPIVRCQVDVGLWLRRLQVPHSCRVWPVIGRLSALRTALHHRGATRSDSLLFVVEMCCANPLIQLM